MRKKRWLLLGVLCLICNLWSRAEVVCLSEIEITGNKYTKEDYILREIEFAQGDCFERHILEDLTKSSRLRLMNTSLFFGVSADIEYIEEAKAIVRFQVEEIFRFSIVPTIDLPDRNFNVWWELKNNVFDRLNYNLKSGYNNISGRNNKLMLITQWGYTQKVVLQYETPFLHKSNTIGLILNILASRQREINYATLNNEQQFHVQDNKFLYRRLRGMAGISYTPELYWRFKTNYEYHINTIDPTVRDSLNANFFLFGLQQVYDVIEINATYDRRDKIPYPEKGQLWQTSLKKEGVFRFRDLNALYLRSIFKQYIQLNKSWFTEHIISGRLGLQRNTLPYNNIRALGFGVDFVRGYEYFMIDGLDFLLIKNSIKYKLLDRDYPLWSRFPLKRYRSFPIKIYMTANSDIGAVNNPFNYENNNFSNRFLYGGGLGIDFVGYYDKVVSLELSINHLGMIGGYLHYKFGIQ